MPIDRDETLVRDMVDMAFSRGKSREDRDADELLCLALVRLIEVIGEAAKGISGKTRDTLPEIPWREITGTRDRLIHGYRHVDANRVWTIVDAELPPLVRLLERGLNGERP